MNHLMNELIVLIFKGLEKHFLVVFNIRVI